MQPSAAHSSSSSSATTAPTPSLWQERLAGGRITTAPPAFTKNGDFLITCTASVLKVYSTKTGEVVKTLRHKSRVTGFFFNPANALQLYSAAEEGIIRLWDFEDGVLLKSWKIGGDGKILQAVLDATHRVAYLRINKKEPRSTKTLQLISTFSLENYTSRVRYTSSTPIAELFVSPRGDFFAALQNNRRGFQLFNVNTKDIQDIRHAEEITSFDFHPTDACVAYGDKSGVIRLNYCLSGDVPKSPKPQAKSFRIDKYEWHTSPVSALKFSPDGHYLLSGAREEVLVLWQLNTANRLFIPRMGAALSSVTINEQGTAYAVCCSDNSVRVIDALSRDLQLSIQGISLDMRSMPIVIEPRDGLVITPFKSNSLQRYDPVNDRHVNLMQVAPNPQVNENENLPLATVKHVAFGPKGNYMATSDFRAETDIASESNIKFWLHDGNDYMLNTAAQDAHSAAITGLACHPILPLVASCSLDGKFKLWEQVAKEAPPGAKNKEPRAVWTCRSVGDFKDLPASALSFSTDGSLLAVAYESTITLWDPMSSTFHRSLTFTNCVEQTITHLAFIPSSRYLIAASQTQLFVWDLVRCTVVWSYLINVKSLAVDMSVNYKANLVFPSPSSLVSSFVVSDGEHIFLFNPSSAKPLHVWKAEKRVVISLAFAATSSLLPEGRIVYVNDMCELVCLEKKLDKKIQKTDQAKVSLSMSKVKSTKKEEVKEKLSAFESAFGKLAVADKGEEVDVGVPVPREDTGTLFNPSAPQLSHLFNGPSHLLPSPAKIYTSFMEGLLKKAHTHVAGADAAQPTGSEEAGDSAMQLDVSVGTIETKSSKLAEVNGADNVSTSKNEHKRQTKAVDKTFYDSMFKFFSSYAPRDSKATSEEPKMPASLLNELTAPVKQPKQRNNDGDVQRQGKGKKQRSRSNSGNKKTVEQESNGETDEPTPATPAAESIPVTTTATTPAKSPRKKKRASQRTAEDETDDMVVENDTNNSSSSTPREKPHKEKESNGTPKTTTPRRRRKSSQQQQE